MNSRKIAGIVAALAAVFALALASAVSAAPPQIETWSNEPTDLFYAGEGICGGAPAAGYGIDSGTVRITETGTGGVHVRGRAEGSIDLYEAFGPPSDVQFGDFIGTFTYRVTFDEEFSGSQNSVSTEGSNQGGQIVYADGSTQAFRIVFRVVRSPEGPPKVFLVKIVCGA